ncbi:hypothetical protein BDZ89DRAFT_1056072 [Hymenopellis radicata]|nr:hypothetical protein BDZ89DRAFT_1056072 [Hymenopellis radicata]
MNEYALQHGTLGDDVYAEPSTIALEAHVAKITGKEAGLFMSSGTLSNQIGIRTHLMQPPYTVLLDQRSHVYKYECGGLGFHSGAAVSTVIPSNGHHLTLADVTENMVYGPDVHSAPTAVISLENTLNGTIFPQDEIIAISKFARSQDVNMHLDGARLWHVAAETGKSMEELCEPFDSVSLCFSKGLGAPIGSMLVGQKEYITRARRFRKLFGGGMRQTGFLAASAAYALTYNYPLLPKVHTLTRKLGAGLREVGVTILSGAETCMVLYDASSIGTTFEEVAAKAKALPEPITLRPAGRLVVHLQTTESAVDDLLAVIRNLADEKRKAGFVRQTPTTNGSAKIYG